MTGYKTIQADQLAAALQSGGAIIDVRTQAEHNEKCLTLPHIHLPMDELTPEALQAQGLVGQSPLYILCLGGKRAAAVATRLATQGFGNLHVIEGGILSCEKCGHDIHRNA